MISNSSVLHKMLFTLKMRVDWGCLIVHTHTCNEWRTKRATSQLTMDDVPLHPPLFPLSFHCFPSISLRLNQFTTALPFLPKHNFSCYLFGFLLQNMYRLFRTTTKIQYPIYIPFFKSRIIINSIGESSWSLSSF